jgi:hypothetical protein
MRIGLLSDVRVVPSGGQAFGFLTTMYTTLLPLWTTWTPGARLQSAASPAANEHSARISRNHDSAVV